MHDTERRRGEPAFGRGHRCPEGVARLVACSATVPIALRCTHGQPDGVYCENCNVAEPVPATSEEAQSVRPWAMDPALAERLWTLSEKITGLGIG